MNAEPRAVVKAQSLYKFCLDQGAVPSTFQLTLTEPEAAELLEWYAGQYQGTSVEFDLDVDQARRTANPWPVLENFQVLGFKIARADLVLH